MVKNEHEPQETASQLTLFFIALMFYTRIPCPKDTPCGSPLLGPASRYLPLVGAIVGIVAAAVVVLSLLVLPLAIAVLLSMSATLLLTGAFHEDGLADAADGFGGGWNPDQILTIMKDSRIGTFGVLALCLTLALKFSLLFELFGSGPWTSTLLFGSTVVIFAHMTSRFAALGVVGRLSYVRADERTKAKPIAKMLVGRDFLIAALITLIPQLFSFYFLSAALLTWGVQHLLGNYFRAHLGGYTGDCLGACQQICEVTYLLGILCVWKCFS